VLIYIIRKKCTLIVGIPNSIPTLIGIVYFHPSNENIEKEEDQFENVPENNDLHGIVVRNVLGYISIYCSK
jgi:hypothetical protein